MDSHKYYYHIPSLLILLGFASLVACTSEGPEPKGPFSTNRIVLEQRNFSIEGTSRSQTFNIDANCAWSITTERGWENLVVTPSEGNGSATVTISTPENDNISTRTASLQVSTGDINIRVSISQLPGRVQLDVSKEKVAFAATGGEDAFSLTCNTDWSITGAPSWLTVTPASGEGSSQPQTITLTAMGHDDEKADTIPLSITGMGVENVTKTVLVTRAPGKLRLDVSGLPAELPAAAGRIKLHVSSNLQWTAIVKEDWAAFADGLEVSGGSSADLLLEYQENAYQTSRPITIIFRDQEIGSSFSKEVSLIQVAGTLPIITDFAVDKASIRKNAVTATFDLTVGNLPTTACGLLVSTEEGNVQNGTRYPASTMADGVITINLTGLSKGQTYYVCAYATNNVGTYYSSVLNFRTKALPDEGDNPTPE